MQALSLSVLKMFLEVVLVAHFTHVLHATLRGGRLHVISNIQEAMWECNIQECVTVILA